MKKLVLSLVFVFVGIAAFAVVKFPSQQQPGVASMTSTANNWTLSNNLFSASYTLVDNKLYFAGSEEFGLDGNTDLFSITLADGTVVLSSQMNCKNVTTENLAGDVNAVKLSEKDNGKTLKATYSYNNLNILWRAVLRDNSHYLRTELEITATADTEMKNVVAMLYSLKSGKTIPSIVGNTRGALLVNEDFFAGLETPMGNNELVTSNTSASVEGDANFSFTSWTASDWSSFSAAPSEILNLGFSASQIVAKKGLVTISAAGNLTFTFTYATGNHRMNLVGVDLVDLNGNVVASDYHIGYTGTLASKNSYTLNVPSAGNYLLRFFGETKTETINSTGNITRSGVGVSLYKEFSLTSWTSETWQTISGNAPQGVLNLGFTNSQIVETKGLVNVASAGNLTFKFQFQSGYHRMNLVGVDLLDSNGNVVAQDYHIGYTGDASYNNSYSLSVPSAGVYTLRFLGEVKTETIISSGTITSSGVAVSIANGSSSDASSSQKFQGRWSRNATLKSGDTWKVSSVIGMMAEGQQRRSFLAYHERERAVPWRSFIHYNSWYELNIDRNNVIDQRMSKDDCLAVVEAWKENLFVPYDVYIDAFVWDDGWDDFNSLWDFYYPKFPNGFKELDDLCQLYNVGTGTWLGPVGGYGSSKQQRLAFWNSTHDPDITNFKLSHSEYFNAFVGRCSQMINDYDMRYFKFDGISDIGNAVGPGNEEDAEHFIRLTSALREAREDIFLNCTVGTWASPFWFQFADAVWRQDADWSTIGNQGNARQRWITYRDYMVYKNFTVGSPLCPINSLMTHGLIVSGFGNSGGNPPRAMEDDASACTVSEITKEMRCAFACGSAMVELYIDHALMTSKENGKLWGELAKCIKWHRSNADVLDDTHWVGGNPWDGSRANVYGWASWNGTKSVLTLRNPCNTSKTFTTTLRQALDIPAYVTGKIYLSDAFDGQTQYAGITNEEVDIDATITFNLPAFDVVVLNGIDVEVLTGVKDTSVKKKEETVFGREKEIVFEKIQPNSKIQIVDLSGIVVKSLKNNEENFSVKVPFAGTYVVNIVDVNGNCTKEKVIVKQ